MDQRLNAVRDAFRGRPERVVLAAAVVVTFLVRMPFLHLPAFADEAGFLQVGGSWHLGHGGSSLYGDYWVDRPPLLITIFGPASHLGGLTALRIFGALAAALSVAGIGVLARELVDEHQDRAVLWGSVAAAALFCTPYHWNFEVDGEILAAPFVVWGLVLVARAFAGDRPSFRSAFLGGFLGACAALTKQNFLDVFVFAALLGLLGWLIVRTIPFKKVIALGATVGAGGAGALVLAALWTLAHGTRLGGVWYAMFKFRVDAARDAGSSAISFGRLAHLGEATLVSGLGLLAAAGLLAALVRGRKDPRVLAVVGLLAYQLFAVAGGTNYWLHYLVQPSITVAALVGILVTRIALVRGAVVVAAVMSLAGVIVFATLPPQTGEERVGDAIGRSAVPGDGLVTFVGRSNVNLSAGLGSPYPYLWSTPARTLDPKYRKLKQLLASPSGPAWFVTWAPFKRVPPAGSVGATVVQHYRRVAVICRHEIYLRDDLDRPDPRPSRRAGASRASACQSVGRLPWPLGN